MSLLWLFLTVINFIILIHTINGYKENLFCDSTLDWLDLIYSYSWIHDHANCQLISSTDAYRSVIDLDVSSIFADSENYPLNFTITVTTTTSTDFSLIFRTPSAGNGAIETTSTGMTLSGVCGSPSWNAYNRYINGVYQGQGPMVGGCGNIFEISVQISNGGPITGTYAHFNGFSVDLPTAQPTTNTPTTDQPTTSPPTTNAPTLVPTTNIPTATSEPTNVPTTNIPTLVPTSTPTTQFPTTRTPPIGYNSTISTILYNDKEVSETSIYVTEYSELEVKQQDMLMIICVTIGMIVVIAISIVIIWVKFVKKKETSVKAENNTAGIIHEDTNNIKKVETKSKPKIVMVAKHVDDEIGNNDDDNEEMYSVGDPMYKVTNTTTPWQTGTGNMNNTNITKVSSVFIMEDEYEHDAIYVKHTTTDGINTTTNTNSNVFDNGQV